MTTLVAAPPAFAPVAHASAGPRLDWSTANQQYLAAAIGRVRAMLQAHVARATGASVDDAGVLAAAARLDQAARAMPSPPALEQVVAAFGLSLFERDLLVLCAGVEFDARFAEQCAAAHGERKSAHATFGLALAALPSPHWSALAPDAPLRRWRLVEVGAGTVLTSSPLRVDERVLHFLTGVQHTDERLAALLEPARALPALVGSHRTLAAEIAAAWTHATADQRAPVVQLCGSDPVEKWAVAAAVARALDLNLAVLPAESLPLAATELWSLVKLWEREAALSGTALLLDCDNLDRLEGAENARAATAARFVERTGGMLLVSTSERLRGTRRAMLTFDVAKAASSEQRATWHGTLGAAASQSLNGHVDRLVSQFNLGSQAIRSAGADALGRVSMVGGSPSDLAEALWDACRIQARPRLDDLAQRIEPSTAWQDLVLPEAQGRILRDVAIHVRQRMHVYERWGFAGKGSRGLGISALFAGASGTGKTMAAEVLAHDLRLDLYRIDLSSTVSKYIGETEKNLRRIFDAAEEGGAILLFDEADALFGKRSEVKDSHDRYANIEVGYLLQRMEAYRGLAVLTTNLKNSLDTAFLRRIRFVVQFPFPDQVQRAEIWRRAFPSATPTEGLDVNVLARLNVAGGNIRNIALHAAFLAADAGEPVQMSHLLRAAQSEYAKLEKPLTDFETAGWSA